MDQFKSELVPDGCDGKADTGKTRMSLLTGQFRQALRGVARVLTFGAAKYPDQSSGDRGWFTVPNAKERYMDAFERHMDFVYHDFEKKAHHAFAPDDVESGEMHIDHAICNLMFLRDLLYGKAYDVRSK